MEKRILSRELARELSLQEMDLVAGAGFTANSCTACNDEDGTCDAEVNLD